jgi:hypothetical protein
VDWCGLGEIKGQKVEDGVKAGAAGDPVSHQCLELQNTTVPKSAVRLRAGKESPRK